MMGEWGRSGNAVAVRASYYYITHYDVGAYTVEMQKSERIENYAIRLKEMVNLLKFRTGADKVDIIAHSMGGLVTRQYLDLFGYKDVNKVITVNTPHHGISGNIKQFCSVLGSSKECTDMYEGSIFLTRLNSKAIPEEVDMHSIRSTGCKMDYGRMGDGVVVNESAYLEGAQNYLIKSRCTDALNKELHTIVLNPDVHPQTYDLIMEILRE
jgi:pimeloyl-ACP methyl ester carboxylesterase